MKQIAIIGFGCAGYHAAKTLREMMPDCQIDVYSNTDTAPANPMLTTYYVAGKISREAVFPFGEKEAIIKELGIRFFENTPVAHVDTDNLKIVLHDESCHAYDDIILASGSHPLIPPISGLPEKDVFVMRTVDDADTLLARIEQGVSSALVIGASWVGIKVIEALYAHHVPSTLADLAPCIFPTAALPEMAELIHDRLRGMGIDLLFGRGIASMRKEEDGIVSVFSDGTEIKTEIVALCMGLRPTVSYLDQQKIEMGRGVRVDRHMRSSVPHIYAVGDCCETKEIMSGEYMSVNLWANATVQGRIAAKNIAGACEEFPGSLVHNITHFLDMDFIGLGNPKLPGDVVEYGAPKSGTYVRAVIKDGKLQCANILGNYRVSGSLKSVFLRQQECPGEPIPQMLYANLIHEGLDKEFINLIGGTGE